MSDRPPTGDPDTGEIGTTDPGAATPAGSDIPAATSNPWAPAPGRPTLSPGPANPLARLVPARWLAPVAGLLRDGHGPVFSGPLAWAVFAGLFVVALAGLSSVHRIGARQQGLVLRFGVPQAGLGPGLALTAPWPIDEVRVEDVTRVHTLSYPEGEAANWLVTADAGLYDVGYAVHWRVSDVRAHQLALAAPVPSLVTMAGIAMRRAIAAAPADVLAGSGREAIAAHAADMTNILLAQAHAGMVVTGIVITRAEPPARLAGVTADLVAARRDADAARTAAQGWARQTTAHALGEIVAFDKVEAEYRKAPAVTRQRIYYETMERVLGQADKVIVASPGVAVQMPSVPQKEVH